MNVDPLLEPSNGPNYFPFDPEIVYTMKIDNDHDAVPDLAFEFRFHTQIRAPGLFTGSLAPVPASTRPQMHPRFLAVVRPPVQSIPLAITALDGRGSEGVKLRQTYTVTLVDYVQNGRSTNWAALGRYSPYRRMSAPGPCRIIRRLRSRASSTSIAVCVCLQAL
jgi:hypothetical protein